MFFFKCITVQTILHNVKGLSYIIVYMGFDNKFRVLFKLLIISLQQEIHGLNLNQI